MTAEEAEAEEAEEAEEAKEIYYINANRGTSIIDKSNNVIGFHSGRSYAKIGDSHIPPLILIITSTYSHKLISGKGVRILGIGIKFIEDYKIWTKDGHNTTSIIRPTGKIIFS